MSECSKTQGWLAQFVDGDLPPEQSAWLGGHLEACAECREALGAFTAIDGELTLWGESLGRRNPPPAGARERLAAALGPLPARRWPIGWMPAAAATIAAAVALVALAPHPKPADADREPERFIEMPYVPPLDPHENTAIVRMNVRVEALLAAGYRLTADPDLVVPADLLVGEDGQVHAVRVLADID